MVSVRHDLRHISQRFEAFVADHRLVLSPTGIMLTPLCASICRLEIGLQSTYEDVARDTNRGHSVAAVGDCFRMAKDAGFKARPPLPCRQTSLGVPTLPYIHPDIFPRV